MSSAVLQIEKGSTNAIFVFRTLIQCTIESQKDVHWCFIDFTALGIERGSRKKRTGIRQQENPLAISKEEMEPN